MSLFKAIEWWGTRTPSKEECDFGCLCVANVDNAANGGQKVIVGSYHGVLHIYSPTEGGGGDRSPHDVLLETQLPGPILQVEAGRFVSVSSDLHLAVLMPRSLTIYAIAVKEGAVDHGNQCIMNKIYEHKLERTAANMTYGPFGGAKDRDSVCVQSMDGTLSIFESENFTFSRFIPGFLMPGPLAYSARMDSFFTVSSSRFLEAYSFQVLAVAADSRTKEESQNITSGKRIKADWRLNLGENALDVKVVTPSNNAPVIMILGQRNLFCAQETGQLIFMKKLEYDPACFYPYTCQDSQTVNSLVCTHSKQLLVYEGISLVWATVLEETPVQVTLGTIGQNHGMIVSLTDSCQVSCSYLGTHPSVFSLPQSAVREPDYATIDQEMEKINNQIKELHTSKGEDVLLQAKDTEDLTVKINVPPTIDRVSVASHQAPVSSEGPVPSITVQIILKASKRVTDVSTMIQVNEPLFCTQRHITIPAIAENDPTPCITVSIFLGKEFSPSDLYFQTVVHYQQSVTGNPKVVTASAKLPITLISWPHDPIKTMEHKVTLESNVPCINLLELFPELSSADAGPNCVGLKLIHGPITTILTSKSSNRYRVQSETFAGLWLTTDELVRRVQKHSGSCRMTHPQPINLEELSPIIDRHFQLRVSKISVHEMLDLRAKQFRAIQRRLLTRFKDKTPAPLNCLDTLLEGTYRQILALADACEENQLALVMSHTELSSALRLIILLAKLWLDLTTEEMQLLESVLCINFKEGEMGWEETMEISLGTLIRTVLSKGVKDPLTAGLTQVTELQMPRDVSKTKKLIGVLFDRLSKGARLIPSQFNQKTEDAGSISNISIGQSGKDFPPPISKRRQPPPIARGISDDIAIDEEDEDAIINDIMGMGLRPSGPPANIKPPTSFKQQPPPVENRKDIYAEPNKIEPIKDRDSTTFQNDINGRIAPERLHETAVEEEPAEMLVKPVPKKSSDDVYGSGDDVIESPSFYDDTSDDLYAM